MYKTVNDMLGDPVKVTPSSKVVGDLAIFMVQNDLTPENIVERGKALAFPDSVVSYFKGMMGQPAWGFPEDLQKVVLKGEEPITCRPGKLLPPVDFDRLEQEVRKFRDDPERKDLISYAMYPKVYEDFCRHRKEYGYITVSYTHLDVYKRQVRYRLLCRSGGDLHHSGGPAGSDHRHPAGLHRGHQDGFLHPDQRHP